MQILLVSAFVAGVWLLQQKSNLLSLFFRYQSNGATRYRSDHDGALIVDFMR